jgi:GTP cyclohydrolase I
MMTDSTDRASALVRELLEVFGHDLGREGLARTPDRDARFYHEYLAPRPLCEVTTFDA